MRVTGSSGGEHGAHDGRPLAFLRLPAVDLPFPALLFFQLHGLPNITSRRIHLEPWTSSQTHSGEIPLGPPSSHFGRDRHRRRAFPLPPSSSWPTESSIFWHLIEPVPVGLFSLTGPGSTVRFVCARALFFWHRFSRSLSLFFLVFSRRQPSSDMGRTHRQLSARRSSLRQPR